MNLSLNMSNTILRHGGALHLKALSERRKTVATGSETDESKGVYK